MRAKFFLVHCGFYDAELCDGIYESHVNFHLAAESMEDARSRAKELPDFRGRKLHVDGVQEIQAVQGFRVELTADAGLEGRSVVISSRHRDLAPKKSINDV